MPSELVEVITQCIADDIGNLVDLLEDREARIKKLEDEVERMRILLGEWPDEPKTEDDA